VIDVTKEYFGLNARPIMPQKVATFQAKFANHALKMSNLPEKARLPAPPEW